MALNLLSPSSPTTASPRLLTLERTATEEHALDSYQNLLLSLARFREVTGRYPKRVTIVGYAMKAARFEQLHRAALRWPIHAWDYIGIDVEDDKHRTEAEQGEVRTCSRFIYHHQPTYNHFHP